MERTWRGGRKLYQSDTLCCIKQAQACLLSIRVDRSHCMLRISLDDQLGVDRNVLLRLVGRLLLLLHLQGIDRLQAAHVSGVARLITCRHGKTAHGIYADSLASRHTAGSSRTDRGGGSSRSPAAGRSFCSVSAHRMAPGVLDRRMGHRRMTIHTQKCAQSCPSAASRYKIQARQEGQLS
jgi:hypothetical protein